MEHRDAQGHARSSAEQLVNDDPLAPEDLREAQRDEEIHQGQGSVRPTVTRWVECTDPWCNHTSPHGVRWRQVTT